MGAIAEGFVAYAQRLLDQTDGSEGQVKKAFAVSQCCFNLALMPEGIREQTLGKMKQSLEMNDEKFDDFRRSIVVPMIRRHEKMFPRMHRQGSSIFSPGGPSPSGPLLREQPRAAASAEPDAEPGRYAPCPRNSGKKYKFCCGKKRR
ncbi:MAG: hypothetical protein GXY25_07165 [Pirellulaceae bacterium]|jgi:hypothetical protein|nr:hypothetical protein [Thermoguttaceae bacterium]NLZ00301.1 hypothetical protein [Pirellulaceae bacterium]